MLIHHLSYVRRHIKLSLSIKTMLVSLSLLLLLLLCPISLCMESQEDIVSSLKSADKYDFDSIVYLPDEQRCDSPLYAKVQISLFVETNHRNGRRILTNHEDRQLEYSLTYMYKQGDSVAADERQVVTQSKALSWCLLVEDPFSNNDQLTLSYSLIITLPSSSSTSLSPSSSIADNTQSSSKLDAVEGVLLCGEFYVKINKPYQIDRNKLLRCKSYAEKVC